MLAAAALEYTANLLWLRHSAEGAVRLFLVCWCNDLFAGAAILAWSNLLLSLGRLPLLDRVRRALPFLLGCGLVWELAAAAVEAGRGVRSVGSGRLSGGRTFLSGRPAPVCDLVTEHALASIL